MELIATGIEVIKAATLDPTTSPLDGIKRTQVLSLNMVNEHKVSMGLAISPPGTRTDWHHHGPCEIGGYVVAGRSLFRWGVGGRESAILEPGDFFQIAPSAVHCEETLGTEDFVIVTARTATQGVTVKVAVQ